MHDLPERALTIRRPWAWAIVHAGKDVENRTWEPPAALVGQRIAIHAGSGDDAAGSAWIRTATGLVVPDRETWSGGRIVATAVLAAVIRPGDRRASPWWDGGIGWRLADLRVLARPVACRGALGLWRVPAELRGAA